MSKAVFAEDSVPKLIEDLVSKRTLAVGLLLGQFLDQHDHVVHLARTPLPVSDESGDGQKTCSLAIEDWNTDLVVQHARQVSRMLPGGFDVLGLFVCTEENALSNGSLAWCKKLLTNIHKILTKSKLPLNTSIKELLLLHISCSPLKISCSRADVVGTMINLKPTNFKTVSNIWMRVQCSTAVNITIPMTKEHTESSLLKQIKMALEPVCVDIKDSLFVVDGQIRKSGELLHSNSRQEKKGIRHNETQAKLPQVKVDLLVNTNSDHLSPSVFEQDCRVVMHMRGTIRGRTYVTVQTTVGDAVERLKSDVIRSLVGRCEIHCEDLLVIDEEHLDRVVVHELPCRVFAPLPCSDISVSDYLFPGEKAMDSLDAFAELFDLSLVADEVESCEQLSEASDLTPLPVEELDGRCTGVPLKELLPPKAQPHCNYLFIGLSVTVALVAGGTSLYLLQH